MSQRLSITFSKSGNARFLSHLDLMATLEYGMRRAGLPLELSEGYNPRPRMSLAAPLPLGHVGEREILEIGLAEPWPADEVGRALEASLPEGIHVLEVVEIVGPVKPAAARLQSAIYRVELPHDVPDLARRVADLLALPAIEIEELRDEKPRIRDIRPTIVSMEAEAGHQMRMELRMDNAGTVRPEQILGVLDIPLDGARLIRERIRVTS